MTWSDFGADHLWQHLYQYNNSSHLVKEAKNGRLQAM